MPGVYFAHTRDTVCMSIKIIRQQDEKGKNSDSYFFLFMSKPQNCRKFILFMTIADCICPDQ